MDITIAPDISLKLGHLELTGCKVDVSSDALRGTYDEVANAAGERFASVAVGEHPVAGGVRKLFKSVGIDPSRYRPSGEALVRRIIKGQGLYHINCIVDINNICSIESLFPMGAYDRANIDGDVTIRLGKGDEVYRGIGKEINVTGKLVSADSRGAFGSPIADSDRTKITEQTQDILVILYAPETTDDESVRRQLDRFAELANIHAGATNGEIGIRSSSAS